MGDSSEDEKSNKPVIKQKKLKKVKGEKRTHPLLTDLDERDAKAKKTHKAELWFTRDTLQGLEDEQDEDMELDRLVEDYKRKGN